MRKVYDNTAEPVEELWPCYTQEWPDFDFNNYSTAQRYTSKGYTWGIRVHIT
jgi:hypothetical protein